jgi:translation initiation factor 2B subunit (eIF-2B alpha/beta/delta family)
MQTTDPEAGLKQIREDTLHGSTYLSDRALELLIRAGRAASACEPEEFLRRTTELARALATARPAMVAIANAVCEAYSLFRQWLERCPADPSDLLAEAARRVMSRNAAKRRMAALRAAAGLTGPTIVLSYSGSLATALAKAPGVEHVYVAEARPLMEGRILASELAAAGKGVTLITEAQMRLFAAQCRMAAIGADAILPDGSVVNKVGSHLLALAARDAGIPLVVVSDTTKVAPTGAVWDQNMMEAHPASEVMEPVPEGVKVANFYFERVPADLVNTVIGERGPLVRHELLRAVETRSRYRDVLFRPSGVEDHPTGV